MSLKINKNDLMHLCARVNNLLMKPSFQGDDVLEAAFLMNTCTAIYRELKEELHNEPKQADEVSRESSSES